MKVAVIAIALVLPQGAAIADDIGNKSVTESASTQSSIPNNLDEWFERSDRVLESQPHWTTPIATITPNLKQEYKYDQLWQDKPKGVDLQNYGFNQGLELITSERTQLTLGVPTYQKETSDRQDKQGFSDESLSLKYRFLSANEENGNYIVTGILGLTIPTGSSEFTTGHTVITPTIAAGKGWGTRKLGFDIQSTLAISYADGNQQELGQPIVWNTAYQAHVGKLWPEIETNITHYTEGINAGKTQTMITIGVISDSYEISERLKVVIGAGYQRAVSSFRTIDNNLIITVRFPF